MDSNSDGFEIRLNVRAMASSSPLTRKHDDDDVSGMEAMLKRRKLPKTTPLLSSSIASKMTWTKNDELLILGGIVDYENETKLSYGSDWDAFYRYTKDSIEASFSKQQLMNKVKKLQKRFKVNHGKGPSFTNTDDDQVFKLSMIIWATKNDTECDSNQSLDQAKDVPILEHERVSSNIGMEIDNGEKEKSDEDVLQNALEATLFTSLVGNQHKLLLQSLRNINSEKRKELSDEWKALLLEELQLNITFFTKLASAAFSP